MPRPTVAFVGPLERVLSLRALPMLRNLSADELAVIAQHTRERSFPKGGYLLEQSSPVSAAYVILDGRVTVQRPSGIEEVGPNESIGFIELLARAPAGVTAQAVVDTQALELDWDAQLDVCEQYVSIYLGYVQYLCERYIAELTSSSRRLDWDSGDVDSAMPARALNLVERAQVLRRSSIFSRCSPDAIWELTRHMSEVRFDAGERVWSMEDASGSFFMLAAGLIRCHRESDKSTLVGTGRTIGMLETMTDDRRWYDATAQSPTTALMIDGEAFVDILEDHFDMAIEYAGAIARGLASGDPTTAIRIA